MPAAKSGMTMFYYGIGIVALLGAVFIGTNVIRNRNTAMSADVEMAKATSEDLVTKAKGVTRGDANSPVKVMVFSDYMCPGCAVFATQIEPQLRATYGERVVEVYHDFPLANHQYSFLAARAARCAEDQGKFWEVHDALFSKQREWSFSATPPVKQFTEYATAAGVEAKAFGECLRSDKHAELVSANLELGERVGVGSTPTVYINGRKSNGPMTWDIIKGEIDQALGSGAAAPAAGAAANGAPTTVAPAPVTGQ